jgi:hypothetical protein
MSCLALLLVALAQSGPDEHAFVEATASRTTCYVEQPIRLTIRFGVEREYLRHNVLQLFTRPLDVPVQLELSPELGVEVADASAVHALAPHPSFALGEEIVHAARSSEQTRAGQTWVVLEIERELVAQAPGRLELPGPLLHFACATRFDQDLVSGSVPLDRSMALVRAAPLALEVLPLPSAGRPPGFVDAVGSFVLHAAAEPRELALGERLTLVLTLEGQGNLGRLALPRLDELPGLHLLGRAEELSGITRRLSCELVVDSPRVREIPAIELEYFDPEAGAYRRASTQPIPLRLRARAPAGEAGFEARPALYVFLGVAALILLALGVGLAKLLRGRRSGNRA